MFNAGTLEINSIEELIEVRKTIANAKGNIGLFWLCKDFKKIIMSNVASVGGSAGVFNGYPKFISTQVTHEAAYEEISKKEIQQAGGKLSSYKSLPRGFISFDIKNNRFIIVGGDWLDEKTSKVIAAAFGIDITQVQLFKNEDYNICEER